MLTAGTAPPRVAVICDLQEEGWPSMDLVAEMLLEHLRHDQADRVHAARVCPPMRRRFTPAQRVLRRLVGERRALPERVWFNADRAVNRFWDYPRLLRRTQGDFELFHVVDHSYGQLVHHLPMHRTVVTCHDLHTFQCVLNPAEDVRSRPFRAMTRHILSGMLKAARVVFDTVPVRDEVLAMGLLRPEQTAVVHLGAHPTFSAEPDHAAAAEAARLLAGAPAGTIDILHIGGTSTRKRIDLLLRVFAALREVRPEVRLIRVGGEFTPALQRMAEDLGLADAIVVLPFLTREVLAAVYRRAALVVIPSEVEGFGLPVVEAMLSGTHVVASDLAVLREVGGEAATYLPVGDIRAWRDEIIRLVDERRDAPDAWERRRRLGIEQANRFSWAEYARKMVDVYQGVLNP